MFKKFDRVNYCKLLEKLNACGLRDKQLKLIQSYLEAENRGCQQRVSVEVYNETYLSNDVEVLSGVPQGSVLCPLLLYI